MLKAWHANDGTDFRFVNSHDKQKAVKDAASKAAIIKSLRLRLDDSKNMVLIVGNTTKNDTDFVPYEIAYAIDNCGIPLIVTYTDYTSILNPVALRPLWPRALADRIDNGSAKAIHIPFKRAAIDDAISQFNLTKAPSGGGLGHYSADAHRGFGIDI